MRIIKFRSYEPETKRMFYPSSIPNPTSSPDRMGGILMQYTGLLDQNSKEIYEGDICKYESYLYNLEAKIVSIAFNQEHVSFVMRGLEKWDCSFLRYNPKEFEVIGNIYENKDLLETT